MLTKIFFLFLLTFAASPSFAKTLVLNSPSGGDFKLPLAEKKQFDTSKLKEHSIILVFGFTQCKSVCPLTMNRLKEAFLKLSSEEQAKTKILFVSVDNERDDLAKASAYAQAFHPQFSGSTTNDKELKKILSQFGARYYRYRTPNKTLLVDHTSDIYVVNKKGIWAKTLSFDASADQVLTALKEAEAVQSFEERFPKSKPTRLVKNKRCDLSKADCLLKIGTSEFAVSLSPRPAKLQQKMNLLLKPKNSGLHANPVEVDLQGIELNMGYLRPQFTKTPEGFYSASFELPLCELKKMNWLLTFIFSNETKQNLAGQLQLTSTE